jgi:hypothetical protein
LRQEALCRNDHNFATFDPRYLADYTLIMFERRITK